MCKLPSRQRVCFEKQKKKQPKLTTCVVMTKETHNTHTHNLRAQGVRMKRELLLSTPRSPCTYTLPVQTCSSLNGLGGAGGGVTCDKRINRF